MKVDFDSILAQLPSLKVVYSPDSFPMQAPNMTPACDDPDKVIYLAFTSGTTGAPKCVMHSDNTLLANARDLVRDWGHGPDTVLLTLSPLSHHIAWVAVAQWLLAGCRLVTDDPPPGTNRLDWILETGATYIMGVPTHAMDVQAEQRARGLSKLGAVRVFYMAGAPIPPSVADAFMRQGIKPQNVYGMTENSSHQYTHPTDDTETIVATCGRGGRSYEVRLFDLADPDRQATPGEIGQIGGRGAALMLGYFDNQIATEASFNRDGWFLSGDIGILDERGNLRIEGRLKDLIIRGGHNISPVHIEALALRCHAIERAACFPVPDERLGERVGIAVIGDVSPTDLLAHLADEGLSKYDMPEYFVAARSVPAHSQRQNPQARDRRDGSPGRNNAGANRFSSPTGDGRMSVELSRREECAVLVLNRPDALNALSFAIVREIGRGARRGWDMAGSRGHRDRGRQQGVLRRCRHQGTARAGSC